MSRFDQLESRLLMTAGTAPTDAEQYMLALINRARANPAAEGQRLLNLAQTDPLIHQATANWDLTRFDQVISSYAPSAPLAFNPRLIDAALAETASMVAKNAQQHSPAGFLTNPSVAADADGQAYFNTANTSWATGENIFAYSRYVTPTTSTAYADFLEAGFLLDWGNPDFGHLKNILAPSPSQANLAAGVYPYSEIGIGLVTDATPTAPAATNVGPALVTQEFAWHQGNAFLTGAFFQDNQGTGFYAPGEGDGGVTITAQGTGGQGTFQVQTWSSGGYSLQLPPGTYNVTATGAAVGTQATVVTIGQDNVDWTMGLKAGQTSPVAITEPTATPVVAPTSGTPTATTAPAASTTATTTTATTAVAATPTPTATVPITVPTTTGSTASSAQAKKAHHPARHKAVPHPKAAHHGRNSAAKNS